MKLLINAIGIADSGGVNVLNKLMLELLKNENEYTFIFLVTKNYHIDALIERHKKVSSFVFLSFEFQSAITRLLYENTTLRKFVSNNDIRLVYNFSGSRQFFIKVPQIIKVHNLLFYCEKLDRHYKNNFSFTLWLKHIYFKRLVFRWMLARSQNLEVQSKHVVRALSDFVDTDQKDIFIKSDIDVSAHSMFPPVEYDFSKTIKFLYIVGPHFNFPHKNIGDFSKAMIDLKKDGIDFEINITVTREQLCQSNHWDNSLNANTNFHGYISEPGQLKKLFCKNTILVSTSVIETLGLHVIEAIKHGLITVTPNEDYATEVYGRSGFTYELFVTTSLSSVIKRVVSNEKALHNMILAQQEFLKQNEIAKYSTILDVFDVVLSK